MCMNINIGILRLKSSMPVIYPTNKYKSANSHWHLNIYVQEKYILCLRAKENPEKPQFYYMGRDVRKPDFCICENKDADQLRGNRIADQRLCFRYMDSTIPLLSKSKISRLEPSSVAVQPGLCRTWLETPKTGFLRTRLI